jgi:hypothetical protein
VAVERIRWGVPWFVVALAGVVVGSAIVATFTIGGGHAALELPAVVTYAIPAAMHFAAVNATWWRAHPNMRLRRSTRQALMAICGILLLVAAIITQQRLGRWDLLAMLTTGIISSAGPVMLALIFFPPERPPYG